MIPELKMLHVTLHYNSGFQRTPGFASCSSIESLHTNLQELIQYVEKVGIKVVRDLNAVFRSQLPTYQSMMKHAFARKHFG